LPRLPHPRAVFGCGCWAVFPTQASQFYVREIPTQFYVRKSSPFFCFMYGNPGFMHGNPSFMYGKSQPSFMYGSPPLSFEVPLRGPRRRLYWKSNVAYFVDGWGRWIPHSLLWSSVVTLEGDLLGRNHFPPLPPPKCSLSRLHLCCSRHLCFVFFISICRTIQLTNEQTSTDVTLRGLRRRHSWKSNVAHALCQIYYVCVLFYSHLPRHPADR